MARLTIGKASCAVVAAMVVLLGCSNAVAKDIGSASSPSQQGPEPKPPQALPQGWPRLSTLLQLPAWMNLGASLMAEPMAAHNPAGSAEGYGTWIQQLAVTSEFGTGLNRPSSQWSEQDHWKGALQLTAFSGNPNLGLAVGTTFPLQTAAHPIGLWLTEASIQRSAGGGALFVKAGVLPLNPGFVQAPVLNRYIHSSLNNTLNLLIPGLPINPFIAPGAQVHVRTGASSEVRLGGFWLNSQTALASIFGVNPGQPAIQGSLQMLQWTMSDLPGSGGLASAITTATGQVERSLPAPLLQIGLFNTNASSSLAPAATNQGLYGNVTLPLQIPIGLDNRFWIGVSKGLQPSANPFPLFLGAGWLNQGLIKGRPFDVLAIGFGRTSFSQQFSTGSYEAVLELNYTYAINSQLSLQPVVQWIFNPGGSNPGAGLPAAGLQINLNL